MIDTNLACRPHRQACRRDRIHRLAGCDRHISTPASVHRSGRKQRQSAVQMDRSRCQATVPVALGNYR